ncbi:shikimate kinase [Desulfobulbus alkaliphilus]|uniref:shikimate kinase n=1 Tax=Desulfobulbus alkaliphilus TaxID=869814 RepID=UPI001962D37B|nr:shikimate kinase [Desulfobulbus alkaliphilus]MBM9536821.1 glycogen/starch synthase [Desulfobulbus alkaliphilus]
MSKERHEKAGHIVLTGFRATGKTSVGQVLAEKIGYRFIDTDSLLCQRLGATVADIVKQHGWAFFRRQERGLLEEMAGTMDRAVVATGGGAIEHSDAWRQLRRRSFVVWLDADIATITARMQSDPQSAGQRPSLTGAAPEKEIAALLKKRGPLYRAGSDLSLDTSSGKTPEELAEAIIRQMARSGYHQEKLPGPTNGKQSEVPVETKNTTVMIEKNRTTIRSVWMVTREYDGLAGAGGVKDVCRQLAETLALEDECRVRVILPRYGFMDTLRLGFRPLALTHTGGRIHGRRHEHVFTVDMNYPGEERRERVAIWEAWHHGVQVYLVEADRFADKRGVYTYTNEDEQQVSWQRSGDGHFDYFAMNILLQKAALDLMILLDDRPDIIHCQDGHAATLPAMMREAGAYRHYFRHTGAVVTIHNAGVGYHQEVGDLDFARAITGLPQRVIDAGLLGGSFDPFIAAAPYAVVNTVSENYGRELQGTPDDVRTGWLGHALLERGVRLTGITNGIDPASFDPTRPETLGLASGFDLRTGELDGKRDCKIDLLTRISAGGAWERVKQLGTLDPRVDKALYTFIGRLTAQKGVDVLIEAIVETLSQEKSHQYLVFGSGNPEFEKQLEQLAISRIGRGRVCFLKGYDSLLANKVYAAGDFFLIPSRYEPCGLTDYIAQLLGNLPIVHRVGGLVKVIDGETGFAYSTNTPASVARAVLRTLVLYQDEPETIRAMQKAAVERIDRYHTWTMVLNAYLHLYQRAMVMRRRD